MTDAFSLGDDLGPAKVIHLYDPRVPLRAIVVVDNVAAGPAIGGTRMAPDVTLDECNRLARAMTFKNAAAGLAHGGAKSVIAADPSMPPAEKERTIRAFARAIATLTEYIPGPDMGTDERCMAWIRDEIGRSVGLPRELGGIPLDEIGATGWGLAVAAEAAQEAAGIRLRGARVAVQGFGSVGRHAARFLAEKGAVLVAASDTRGTLHHPDGVDLAALDQAKREGRSVLDGGRGHKLDVNAIVGIDCDIWIPAARPDVVTARNVGELKTRLVLQGANIPLTADAETVLHRRGVLSLPDFVVNAGGVICAAVEYHGGTETAAMATIAEKIAANTRALIETCRLTRAEPRAAAVAMARQRIERAMTFRRVG